MTARRLAICFTLALASSTAALAQAPTPPQQPPAKPEEPPIYEEQVVVTASKVEQQLVNAPATVSVVTADVIASTPATNYAELFRSVPGVNLSQTSARDFNLTMRGATSTLATSTLALLDGRSLYLDFFGFVAWDLLPVNPNELKQIEVIRGPASAVWGANAMNGVVNFISKTPRELNGNSATVTFGSFDRTAERGERLEAGTMFGINGTHARAVNDRWAYKISAGGYTSDAFPRPTGAIPNGTGTQYPAFANQGTTQPKVDGRVDYDAPDGKYKLAFAGGYSGTDGIIHTGIGPFDMTGVGVTYGTMRFARNSFKLNFFTNMLNGDASGLLAIGVDGRPILFQFDTKTYDFEVGNINTFGGRHVVSYGGNVRFNSFDLSIAPRGDNRTEMGGYLQDEIFLNTYLRFSLGARIDKYGNLDNPVFSPRVAVILKPSADQAVRVSFNNEPGHPVARVRRHPQAPDSGRTALRVLGQAEQRLLIRLGRIATDQAFEIRVEVAEHRGVDPCRCYPIEQRHHPPLAGIQQCLPDDPNAPPVDGAQRARVPIRYGDAHVRVATQVGEPPQDGYLDQGHVTGNDEVHVVSGR